MNHTKPMNSNIIESIQQTANDRVAEIFDALNLDYNERPNYLQCKCPIHDGDNPRSLYWTIPTPHWRCVTRHCERDTITGPSSSIFGLVRGTLSNRLKKPCTFLQAVDFVIKVLGLKYDSKHSVNDESLIIDRTIREYRRKIKVQKPTNAILLCDVLSTLTPDDLYYPNRGIPPDIIKKYHISICRNAQKPFFNRAFFPVLDETGKYVIGWSARSIFDKCEKCNLYHSDTTQKCPDQKYQTLYAKWRHSKDFKTESILYNYWSAKYFIKSGGVAIICEGPGDVWTLETAEIKNSVAMFGLNLSKQQRLLLQRAGALTLVFILDNDDAGKRAIDKLNNELQWFFKLVFIAPNNVNDIGDMLLGEINEQIIPIIQQVSKKKILGDG
jgi:5S rRNA maturation endonuclease (ribonuclease M5)